MNTQIVSQRIRPARAALTFLLFVSAWTGAPRSSEAAPPYAGRTPAEKLTASDTQNNDQFGQSVAISGNLAIVGAQFEDGDGGDNRGAAYVFNLTTGDELFKLTASDTEDTDFFGNSVAISGNLAIVGAVLEDGDGGAFATRGAAYVFDLTTGNELFKLTASDTEDDDQFGQSVALSGNLAIVGASGEDGDGNSRGAAYVFDLTTGDELFKLIASDTEDNDHFGASVAISGNLAIVGANIEDGDGGVDADRGAAYVFDLTTGDELSKLTASDTEDSDFFGTSVALSGNLALIGALGEDGDGNNRGAAYVFDLTTGNELFKLTASDTENLDQFAQSVTLSGTLAIAGAQFEDGDGESRGAAYVFDLTTGAELFKLTASDTEDIDQFGNSVALSGKLAIVGANREGGDGGTFAFRGAAYVYEIPTYQPDNLIGRQPFSGRGDDIHNSTGVGQIQTLLSRSLRPVKAWLTVQNDGDVADDYTLASRAGNSRFRVTYLRRIANTESNVTAAVVAGTHKEANVVPEEAGRLLCIEIKPARKLRRQKRGRKIILRRRFTTRVTTSSGMFDFKKDTAAVSVRTR